MVIDPIESVRLLSDRSAYYPIMRECEIKDEGRELVLHKIAQFHFHMLASQCTIRTNYYQILAIFDNVNVKQHEMKSKYGIMSSFLNKKPPQLSYYLEYCFYLLKNELH